MRFKGKYFVIILFALKMPFIGSSQNEASKEVLESILLFEPPNSVSKSLTASKIERELLNWFVQALRFGEKDSLQLTNKPKTNFEKALYYLYKGDYNLSRNIPKDSIGFDCYLTALEISVQAKDTILTRFAYRKIIHHLFGNRESKEDLEYYLEKYKEYANMPGERANYLFYRITLDASNTGEAQIARYQKALYLAEKEGFNFLQARINMLLGINYIYFKKRADSAKYYYEKALDIFESFELTIAENSLFGVNTNLGLVYFEEGKMQKAIQYFKRAEKNELPQNSYLQRMKLFSSLSNAYKELGKYDSAFFYIDREKEQNRLLKEFEKSVSITEISEKYNNEKLRADNLLIEQKRIKNRNWLIAAGLALIFGTGVSILLQKNTTKKRQLAEQEAALKQQRVENLLKAQELVSIDAMIAGQEKERQKVAGELHDDLGSLMATIKLHFDNSKISKQDPALKNAQKLLEEAYQKIRGMAHSKNSGVMSDQGLLAAIRKMALTITDTNALEVTVEDFGLGERLENSLELSIFRMVQELVANAIKHSEASKVNIQLTQHEENLNIILEDNGKGFDRSKVDKNKSGMGLTNIEKRVEHLEGNFTVDSIVGKGTSILIDIPV